MCFAEEQKSIFRHFLKSMYLVLKLKEILNKKNWGGGNEFAKQIDLNINFRPFWIVTVGIATNETLHSFPKYSLFEVEISSFFTFQETVGSHLNVSYPLAIYVLMQYYAELLSGERRFWKQMLHQKLICVTWHSRKVFSEMLFR